MKRYGSEKPPVYDLRNLKTVPVAMFVGTKDDLAVPEDTRWERD